MGKDNGGGQEEWEVKHVFPWDEHRRLLGLVAKLEARVRELEQDASARPAETESWYHQAIRHEDLIIDLVRISGPRSGARSQQVTSWDIAEGIAKSRKMLTSDEREALEKV